MLLPLLLLAPGDELVAASFDPPALQVFDVPTGALERTLGFGSPLAGTLGATIGPDGLLYVASEATNEVLRFEPSSGAWIDAFVTDDPNTTVDETGGLDGPSGVLFGPDGRLYVGSFNGDSVLAYDGRSGAFDAVFVQSAAGGLNGPDSGMAFGPDGSLYVPSYWNRRVKRYDGSTGAFIDNFLTPATSGLRNPRAVFFPGDGTVLATSEGSDEVLRFDAATGAFLDVFIGDDPATPGDESGGLDGPTGIVRTPDGTWWVASVNTDDIKRYASDGASLGTPIAAGSGGLATPVHLVLRPRTTPGCAGSPNSAGAGAALVARGSTSVSADDFALELSFAPPQQLVVAVQGTAGPPMPAGDGAICLSGALFRRAVATTDARGHAMAAIDLASPQVPAAAIVAGSTWSFQAAYRDPAGPGSTGFNFSASLGATFGP
ncbi:MAG: hypothetical protein AAF957_22635 [Planctomycetota bacterium]